MGMEAINSRRRIIEAPSIFNRIPGSRGEADNSHALSPVRIAAFLQPNSQRTVGICRFVAGPSDGTGNPFGLQLSPQNHLLPIHTFWQDERSLANLPAIRVPRIKITANLEASVESF